MLTVNMVYFMVFYGLSVVILDLNRYMWFLWYLKVNVLLSFPTDVLLIVNTS